MAVANLLAGEAHIALGNAVPFASASVLRRAWEGTNGGTVILSPTQVRYLQVQLRPEYAKPAAVMDLQGRRALAHAIDKSLMVDVVLEGSGRFADTFEATSSAAYPAVDRVVTRYSYDPRRTEQLLEGVGFRKGAEGFFVGASGRLDPELRGRAGQEDQEAAIVVDNWRRAGVEASLNIISAAQSTDTEFRSTFPGFAVSFTTMGGDSAISKLITSMIPRPSNRSVGNNRGAWSNSEFDRLTDELNATLERDKGPAILAQAMKIISDECRRSAMLQRCRRGARRRPRWSPSPGRGNRLHQSVPMGVEVVLKRPAAVWLILATLAAGCVNPAATVSPGGQATTSASQAPKKLTAAIQGDPHTVFSRFDPSGTTKGIAALQNLVHADLFRQDTAGNMLPHLAEAVPTTNNGMWKVFPDGRMETSWRIRENARWHDGQPVTSQDFLFATTLGRDKDVPMFGSNTYELVESISAPDPRTFSVTWKAPYIRADRGLDLPLPKHILERTYLEDKSKLAGLPFFLEEWVGAGPFKLREVARGSHLIVDANNDYVFGRPKIDVIEVKFILDVNTILARLLSGDIDMFMERGISLDQALQIKDRWTTGSVKMGIASLAEVWPQLLNPTPAIIANVDFRRALFYALDRQEMADTMQYGLVPIAHTIVNPTEAEYQEIERAVVKYEYDPRKAEQMIGQLGYTKAADGRFRDSANEPLTVKIEATSTDINVRTMLSTADYWKRIGVGVDTETISAQAQSDLALRSNFVGFSTNRIGGEADFLTSFHSREARVAENRYRGSNRPRYMNPAYDELADRYTVTIPFAERMEVARQLAHIISDQVVFMPLVYDPQPLLVSNRLRNIFPREGRRFETWNTEQWEIMDRF